MSTVGSVRRAEDAAEQKDAGIREMAVVPRGHRGMRIDNVWLAPCAMFPSLSPPERRAGTEEYVGLDAHARTCALAVKGPTGKRLTSKRGGDKRGIERMRVADGPAPLRAQSPVG